LKQRVVLRTGAYRDAHERGNAGWARIFLVADDQPAAKVLLMK